MTLYLGDCLEVMRGFDDNSISALVTDPPAGISFMNAEWDHHKGGRAQWVAWMKTVMEEALRVAKPGAHMLCWALPRTSHWTATAIEDAGWEIRDVITHLFAQGFPKSHNIGDGQGTALKPASEHWILARKPLSEPTVTANVLKWGTGALNIDAGRIGTTEQGRRKHNGAVYDNVAEGYKRPGASMYQHKTDWEMQPAGCWPANVTLSHADECEEEGTRRVKNRSGSVTGNEPSKPAKNTYGEYQRKAFERHAAADGTETVGAWTCVDGCPVKELDEQAGERTSGGGNKRSSDPGMWAGKQPMDWECQPSTGGASRFFFVAKPSRREREQGLARTATRVNDGRQTPIDNPYQRGETERMNTHPTVISRLPCANIC